MNFVTISLSFLLLSLLRCSSQIQMMQSDDETVLILRKVAQDIGEISGVLQGLVEKVASIESSLISTKEADTTSLETIIPMVIKKHIDTSRNETEAMLSQINDGINGLLNTTSSFESFMNSIPEETSSRTMRLWSSRQLSQVENMIQSSAEDTKSHMSKVMYEMKDIIYQFKCFTNNNIPYGSSCYILKNDKKTWSEARQQCQTMRGDLAKVYNEGIREALRDKVTKLYWIGLSDTEKEGTYVWSVDKEVHNPDDYQHWWNEGEPNDHDGIEDCIHFRDDMTLNDITCSKEMGYICEVKLTKL